MIQIAKSVIGYGGELQVGVARSEPIEPDQGEPRYEIRLKWIGNDRGPNRVNAKSQPSVVVSVRGVEALAAISKAISDFVKE